MPKNSNIIYSQEDSWGSDRPQIDLKAIVLFPSLPLAAQKNAVQERSTFSAL